MIFFLSTVLMLSHVLHNRSLLFGDNGALCKSKGCSQLVQPADSPHAVGEEE